VQIVPLPCVHQQHGRIGRSGRGRPVDAQSVRCYCNTVICRTSPPDDDLAACGVLCDRTAVGGRATSIAESTVRLAAPLGHLRPSVSSDRSVTWPKGRAVSRAFFLSGRVAPSCQLYSSVSGFRSYHAGVRSACSLPSSTLPQVKKSAAAAAPSGACGPAQRAPGPRAAQSIPRGFALAPQASTRGTSEVLLSIRWSARVRPRSVSGVRTTVLQTISARRWWGRNHGAGHDNVAHGAEKPKTLSSRLSRARIGLSSESNSERPERRTTGR